MRVSVTPLDGNRIIRQPVSNKPDPLIGQHLARRGLCTAEDQYPL